MAAGRRRDRRPALVKCSDIIRGVDTESDPSYNELRLHGNGAAGGAGTGRGRQRGRQATMPASPDSLSLRGLQNRMNGAIIKNRRALIPLGVPKADTSGSGGVPPPLRRLVLEN